MLGRTASLLASASLALGLAGAPARSDENADAAIVAGAVAILGIAALAHNSDHYRPGQEPKTEQETADFERGYRDGLHNEPYDSRHSTAAYGSGFDAGHKERANRLARKNIHKDDKAPHLATSGCVGEASAQWGRNPRDIHVVNSKKGSFSQAGGQEFRVEVSVGHKHGVCDVSAKGAVFKFHKGHL